MSPPSLGPRVPCPGAINGTSLTRSGLLITAGGGGGGAGREAGSCGEMEPRGTQCTPRTSTKVLSHPSTHTRITHTPSHLSTQAQASIPHFGWRFPKAFAETTVGARCAPRGSAVLGTEYWGRDRGRRGAWGERIGLPSPLVGLGLCAHACEGVNLRVSICVCECVLWLNTHPSVCTSPSVEMGWGLGPLDEVWGLCVDCGSRFPQASLFTTGVLGVCMCVCVCAQLCTAHPYMCL